MPEPEMTPAMTEAFSIALDECEAVFLSVDVDVVDPGMAPGAGTPEPGGLPAGSCSTRCAASRWSCRWPVLTSWKSRPARRPESPLLEGRD